MANGDIFRSWSNELVTVVWHYTMPQW